jgi:hypothetical protein
LTRVGVLAQTLLLWAVRKSLSTAALVSAGFAALIGRIVQDTSLANSQIGLLVAVGADALALVLAHSPKHQLMGLCGFANLSVFLFLADVLMSQFFFPFARQILLLRLLSLECSHLSSL